MTPIIHKNLASKGCLPSEHYLDSAYIDAQLLVDSLSDYEVAIMGKIPSDRSWQAKQEQGFDLSSFTINWETKCDLLSRQQVKSIVETQN